MQPRAERPVNTQTPPGKILKDLKRLHRLSQKMPTKEQHIMYLLLYPARSNWSRRHRTGYGKLRLVAKRNFVGYTWCTQKKRGYGVIREKICDAGRYHCANRVYITPVQVYSTAHRGRLKLCDPVPAASKHLYE